MKKLPVSSRDSSRIISRTGVIIVTSYETHKSRTATKVMRIVQEGIPYDPPRYNSDGSPKWETLPVKKEA